MYGLVNRAIEQLVVSLKGEDTWQRVCARAGVQADGFVAMCPYHDDMTFALVAAVSEELGLQADQVLEAFGEYWILYTAEEGYAEMLASGGNDLRSFMANLDDMHGRVEMIFPAMQLPQFSVVDIDDGRFHVHYRSARRGLAAMVTGLLRGLAKRFAQSVEVQHLVDQSVPGEDVFLVSAAQAVH
jgi:hypothetical protein